MNLMTKSYVPAKQETDLDEHNLRRLLDHQNKLWDQNRIECLPDKYQLKSQFQSFFEKKEIVPFESLKLEMTDQTIFENNALPNNLNQGTESITNEIALHI